MRIIRFLLALLVLFLLVSCAPVQEKETPTAAPPTAQPTVATLPTETTAPPTPTTEITATPATAATDTAVPLTPTSELLPTATAAPTFTPTLVLPPISGRITYLWSPEFSIGESPLTYNLSFAIPGSAPGEWQIQTALSGLSAQFMFLSPNESRLALTQYKNIETGELGYSRFGGNTFDVYVYELADGSFVQLTDNHFEQYPEVSWLPNSQAFTYPMDKKIWLVTLDNPSPIQLTDSLAGYLYKHISSPDGDWLAIFSAIAEGGVSASYGARLDMFDFTANELLPLVSGIGNGQLTWSSTSRWLAFNYDQNHGLLVVDVNTLTMTELVGTDFQSNPAWSPDGEQLAFVQDTFSLRLWDANTQITTDVAQVAHIEALSWSPDSSKIVLTVFDEAQAKLIAVDVASGNTQELFAVNRVDYMLREDEFQLIRELKMLDWSPDGEWLLVFAEQEDKAGFYVINREGGNAYLVLETGLYNFDSRNVIWLSD